MSLFGDSSSPGQTYPGRGEQGGGESGGESFATRDTSGRSRIARAMIPEKPLTSEADFGFLGAASGRLTGRKVERRRERKCRWQKQKRRPTKRRDAGVAKVGIVQRRNLAAECGMRSRALAGK